MQSATLFTIILAYLATKEMKNYGIIFCESLIEISSIVTWNFCDEIFVENNDIIFRFFHC